VPECRCPARLYSLVAYATLPFELKNYSSSIITVQPGEAITYKITYLSIPLGLKLQTNQMGYGRFFTDLGFDPKIVIGGRADIPSVNIKGGNALPELNTFNLSFHIMAGMEYPLVENNSLILGIGYDKNLFDITRDNGDQLSNVVCQKVLSFRIGITF
jgi:Outer membrane protein beta-barrel domain